MDNLEPKIYRQRLIVEGHYSIDANHDTIRDFLTKLSEVLKMRVFAGPFSWPPDERSHPEVSLNELNGFVAWTESGCHVYAWRSCKFFTVDIYSCKNFSPEETVSFIKDFFKSDDLVHKGI